MPPLNEAPVGPPLEYSPRVPDRDRPGGAETAEGSGIGTTAGRGSQSSELVALIFDPKEPLSSQSSNTSNCREVRPSTSYKNAHRKSRSQHRQSNSAELAKPVSYRASPARWAQQWKTVWVETATSIYLGRTTAELCPTGVRLILSRPYSIRLPLPR